MLERGQVLWRALRVIMTSFAVVANASPLRSLSQKGMTGL